MVISVTAGTKSLGAPQSMQGIVGWLVLAEVPVAGQLRGVPQKGY
jgi:hypothetical protein